MQQTIQVHLEDKPGALMRVAGIVTAKGCNITSLTLAPDTIKQGTSWIVLVADVEDRHRTRIVAEMNRLINVFAATDISC